jgi:hypothetical protein
MACTRADTKKPALAGFFVSGAWLQCLQDSCLEFSNRRSPHRTFWKTA